MWIYKALHRGQIVDHGELVICLKIRAGRNINEGKISDLLMGSVTSEENGERMAVK